MKEKFYFCFSFNKMTLLNNVQENLVASTEFQLQVLKNKNNCGYSNSIACRPDAEGVIHLHNESISLVTYTSPHQNQNNNCEIRLLEIIPGGERIVGSYQFLLDNYIQANKNLHRSCVEMLVQIGQNFQIQYVVYLQSTKQALEKIVKQHQTAKELHMLYYQQQEPDFLPEQITSPREQQQRVIQFDLQSPLVIHQRFWSPTKLRNRLQKESEATSPLLPRKIARSLQKDQKRRMSFLKMKKANSIISDHTSNLTAKKLFQKRARKISGIIQQEVQEFAGKEDTVKNEQKLYEVITSRSKVTSSPRASQDQKLQACYNRKVSSAEAPTPAPVIPVNKLRFGLRQLFFILFMIVIGLAVSPAGLNVKKKRKGAKKSIKKSI